MAVKIKLKRMGKIREPYFRIVVADARTKRDGRAIEEIGKYHPKADPSLIEVNSERAQHWLSVGAQPTDPVRKLLEVTGDWQRFKGLPGADGTLKTAAPRSDKKQIFAAALAETLSESAAAPKSKGRAGAAKTGEAKPVDRQAGEAKAAGKGEKAEAGKAGEAKAAPKGEKAEPGKAGEAKAAGKGEKAEAGKSAAAKSEAGKTEGGKDDGGKAEGGKAQKADKPARAAKSETATPESAPADSEVADSGA